jgi:hypothetical protein
MNLKLKNGFPPFRNEPELRSAIESVCAEFGKVTDLTILPASAAFGLQCTCILRLESSLAEEALRSKFNVIREGADVAFFATVDREWAGPRN